MLQRLLLITLAAILVTGVAYADQSKSNIVIRAGKTAPYDGKQMYGSYCAPCHGMTGRGHGPVAPALKSKPTDLTMLSRNNGAKFPADHVTTVLQYGAEVTAHGSAEMPVWGPIFGKMNQMDPQEKQLRISNLIRFLQSIQAK